MSRWPGTEQAMHRVLLTGLVMASMGLFGCELPRMPWQPAPETVASDGETAIDDTDALAEDESGGSEEASGEDESDTMVETSPMQQLPYAEVSIPVAGQLPMYARLYDPSLSWDEDGAVITPYDWETEYAGPRYPLVILLHGLNQSHQSWHDFPHTLVQAGYAVLAVDLRGHGQSTRTRRNRRINWRMLQEADWARLHLDIVQALRYLETHTEEYPQLDVSRVALVGDRLGANLAPYVGKAEPDRIKALVMLSPGLVYKGIDASRGLMGSTRNVLIVTSTRDAEAATTARHLYNWVVGSKTLKEYDLLGQGSDFLRRPAVGQQICAWLMEQLPPPSKSADPTSAFDAETGGG